MDHHEELRKKIDLFPIGLPESEESEKMLRLLFSRKDAQIAAHVPLPPLFHTARRIAGKAEIGRREASERLEKMAGRGLIIEVKVAGEKRYALFPAMPGFLEMQFMMGQRIGKKRREVGRLWHESLKGGLGSDVYDFPTSGFRIVPVGKTVDATQKVYNFEEVEKLIRRSGGMALGECACRRAVGNCDAPLDVCMIFNPMGDYLADRGLARRVRRREAMGVLERAEKAGLVHVSVNTRAPVMIICNCCACCCAAIHGVTQLDKPTDNIRSNFRAARVRGADCKLCGVCEKYCPTGAVAVGKKNVRIKGERCIGCGVCVHKCRRDAMTLVRKGDRRPPQTMLHLFAKMYDERGKADKVLRSVAKDIF